MLVSFSSLYFVQWAKLCPHYAAHICHYAQVCSPFETVSQWTKVSLLLRAILGNQVLLFPLWQSLVEQQQSICSHTHRWPKTFTRKQAWSHTLIVTNILEYTHCETVYCKLMAVFRSVEPKTFMSGPISLYLSPSPPHTHIHSAATTEPLGQ